MHKFHMDGERKINFGTRTLQFFEMTPTGENLMLEIESGWTARHIENDRLLLNHWEMEILDSEELFLGLINKTSVLRIGDEYEFKIIKGHDLAAHFGMWKFVIERV